VVFYSIIALLVVLIGSYVLLSRAGGVDSAGNRQLHPMLNPEFHRRVVKWFHEEYKRMRVQIKILITTYQITSSIPESLIVTYPAMFSSFLHAMAVFNFNILSVLPVNCTKPYSFIDRMIMHTLSPIALSVLLFVLCYLEYVYVCWRRPDTFSAMSESQQKDYRATHVSKYLTYFFFLTYLVLPSTSTMIFRTFLCTNLDPLNEDPLVQSHFLTADMQVSCGSTYYRWGVAYASVMIFVYVVGVPSMYLGLLHISKEAIMRRHEITSTDTDDPQLQQQADREEEEGNLGIPDAEILEDDVENGGGNGGSGEEAGNSGLVESFTGTRLKPQQRHQQQQPQNQNQNKNQPSWIQDMLPVTLASANPNVQISGVSHNTIRWARMIKFLWEAYEPKFWYWEFVETTRRLMLTAVLSVCGTGTAAQAVLAVLLALVYIKLYGFFNPYVEDSDDIVAETGQFQIFLSFLGALIYQRHLLGTAYNSAVGITLIVVNTGVFVLFLYFTGGTLVRKIWYSTASGQAVSRATQRARVHLSTIAGLVSHRPTKIHADVDTCMAATAEAAGTRTRTGTGTWTWTGNKVGVGVAVSNQGGGGGGGTGSGGGGGDGDTGGFGGDGGNSGCNATATEAGAAASTFSSSTKGDGVNKDINSTVMEVEMANSIQK
jgi:hypothetical protein